MPRIGRFEGRGRPMVPNQSRVVLALGAHTDDVELGAGGTLSRLKREGWTVVAVAGSRAEGSLPPEFERDTLEQEFRKSMKLLGASHVEVLGYPVRRLHAYRQELLEDFIRLRKQFEPELVLVHSSNDTHQDHSTTYHEAVRAFRSRSVLGYHSPWNERRTDSAVFIKLLNEDLELKRAMVSCYESQRKLGRDYVQSDYVGVAARYAGFQSGEELAEAFECISIKRSDNADCW
ncbi:PIG-L deacetylase family protein [Dietzia sp. SL131]|uniref:PIG-L deacetylase family protein n=1 Tax=Dietzia sp. SL131 TaxID=2995149 RepID=UPI003FA356AD